MPANPISSTIAESIANELYNLKGDARALPGEIDYNFHLNSPAGNYLLKISPPKSDHDSIEFQTEILDHLKSSPLESPEIIPDFNGKKQPVYTFEGDSYIIRLLTWIDGTLWSMFSPITSDLLKQLGKTAGNLTNALQGFSHPFASRSLEWDVSQASWITNHLDLFEGRKRAVVDLFIERFNNLKTGTLRRAVVHNDVNDNNIILREGEVAGIIDYGDAIETEVINDVAVALAYALMGKPDILRAARELLEGYNSTFPLLEEELDELYTRTAIRLIISVTKSAINFQENPDNEYLQISEKPAWELLMKLADIPEKLALAHFRKACGYSACGSNDSIISFLESNSVSMSTLLPTLDSGNAAHIDMSIGSVFFDSPGVHQNITEFELKLNRYAKERMSELLVNGYGEVRPFYSTPAYRREGNCGPEYRTVHLGVDFWAEANTPVHAPLDGIVHAVYNNEGDKDYGPTIILSHSNGPTIFFSLYGHLSKESLSLLEAGERVLAGELIGWLGNPKENGNWVPHLHFQLISDMLDNEFDFPGVAYPVEAHVWKDICPNPSFLFDDLPKAPNRSRESDLLEARKSHLGRGMSLSYNKPLTMLRGEGAYLIDSKGRKYLDTVNNVAHVGHEHPRVVRAGQQQMGVLNTNTRYLHPNLLAFAEKLISTLPSKLSVVHIVNSGSEANELALRMAYTVTGQRDILAVEVGYHGNTTGTVGISSYKFDGKGGTGAPEHTHVLPLPDAYRGLYQGADTGALYAAHASKEIERINAEGRAPAAFICESILSCGGQIELPDGYLNEVYVAVRDAGGLCIADEVQVGCGRIGSHYWAFETHGIIPDIVTIGKPIGNGHPLAAVICTPEVADAFANGMEYFNTFGGNPVSSAIGLEVLSVIEEQSLQENANSVGRFLKSGLQELQSRYPCIGDVRGRGFFLGFELCDTNKLPLPRHASYLANRARSLGILMSTDGPDHNVIKIKPPMVFSTENAEELLTRLNDIFSESFMLNY